MNATEAIRAMMDASGMTATELSRAMGKSDSYIRTTLANNTSPRVDNLALMAEIMGFELMLIRNNETIRLG